MTLFELQAWLGHSSADTTQHHAKITPNTLSKAYAAAAAGEPWQYYDLGRGFCNYTFFE